MSRGKIKHDPHAGAMPNVREYFKLKHADDRWSQDMSSMTCGVCKEKFSALDGFFHDHADHDWCPTRAKSIAESPVGIIIKRTESETFPLYYCVMHPEFRNFYLETIEHHIKYSDAAAHRAEIEKRISSQNDLAAAL